MLKSDIYIGTTIGNYVIKSRLSSSGGSATVFLGENNHSRVWPLAAIKLPNTQLDSSEEQERFLREASLLRQLKHDHILSIIDAGFLPNTAQPYLIIEYAPNGSLKDRLERATQPMPAAEAVTILFQIGLALQYAHAREPSIVHCDVKPDNILFNSQGRALLADFGIADVLDAAKTKIGDSIKGSIAYMAPEQFEGKASTKSDQYALGCIAYELLTGQKPFLATTQQEYMYNHLCVQPISPTQINPALPEHMAQAVLKALAKYHKDRYESVEAFITALSVSFSQPTVGKQQAFVPPQTGETIRLSTFTPPNTDPIQPQKAGEQWLREGHTLVQAQRYEEALQAFEAATLVDSKAAYPYVAKGKTLAQLNRRAEAVAAFQQALHCNPDFAEAFMGLGDISSSFNNYPEALKYYQEAARTAPKEAFGYYGMGNVFNELSRYAEALDAYESALRCNAQLLDAYSRKAAVLVHLNRPDEAITTYEQLFSLAPNSIDSRQIVLLHPITIDASYKKAALLERLHELEQAIVAYDQIIRQGHNALNAGYKKAALLERLGRLDQALATYDHIIYLNPNARNAYRKKVALLERLNRPLETIAAYDQLIEHEPENASAYAGKARVLEQLEVQTNHHPRLLLLLEKVLAGKLQPFISRCIARPNYHQALFAYAKAFQLSGGDAAYGANMQTLLQRLGKIHLAAQVDQAVQKRNLTPVKQTWKHWPALLLFLNALCIVVIASAKLHSWPVFFLGLMLDLASSAWLLAQISRPYGLYPATQLALSSFVVSLGWAYISWLLLAPAALAPILIALLLSFLGNGLLSLYLDIYGMRWIQLQLNVSHYTAPD